MNSSFSLCYLAFRLQLAGVISSLRSSFLEKRTISRRRAPSKGIYANDWRKTSATGAGFVMSCIRTICRSPTPLATTTVPRLVKSSKKPRASEIETIRATGISRVFSQRNRYIGNYLQDRSIVSLPGNRRDIFLHLECLRIPADQPPQSDYSKFQS